VQFLCDGIAESLINWLSTVPNIKVVSKSAAFRIRDATDDVAAIANNLGVDGIVLGRLEKIGDQNIV
jgi:TolB-like protein